MPILRYEVAGIACKGEYMKKRFLLLPLVLLAAISSLFAQAQIEQVAERQPVTISVVATTDVHGDIYGFSYENNKETKDSGLARVYPFVQEVRKENPTGTILVDDGDMLQGTILTDDIFNKTDGPHPVVQTMNYMGYDAMTLGNHEFNFGLGLINRLIAQADFPILAANVTYKDGTPLAKPYTILERDGLRIAIIGLTNPNAPRWDGDKVAALTFTSAADSCRKVLDELKGKADIYIALAHMGETPEYDIENGSDSGDKIAETCPELSALMLGHYHIDANTVVNGVPILSCQKGGKDVARFDIHVGPDKKVTSVTATLTNTKDYPASDEIRNLPFVKKAQQETVDYIHKGIKLADGSTKGGVLGEATADFQPANEIKGIPQGKLEDTAVVDLINNIQLAESGADVSAAALFKDTSDLPKGPLNYGNVFDIYKYDNTLYTVVVTGQELKNYMEWAVKHLNTFKPGDLTISFDKDIPGYLYDMFQGVDYQVDISKPVGQRIVNLTFKGKPLKMDQKLTLAVNNYRYSSALKAQHLVAGTRNWESSASIRDMIVAYLQKHKTISPEVDHNWKLIGYSWDKDLHQKAVQEVNDGILEVPYYRSLTAADLK
jgi:2',3'-cyclic-nucleotide 2'-phosphodiesterase/3'-nucleotidase